MWICSPGNNCAFQVFALQLDMETRNKPLIMLLDGDNTHTLQVAAELSQDHKVDILGIGSHRVSRLLRSRYTKIKDIASTTEPDQYQENIIDLAFKHRPDMVIPIGFRSVSAVSSIRNSLPATVNYCLPAENVLRTAFDKHQVLHIAKQLKIQTPVDYSNLITKKSIQNEDQVILKSLPFPIFLKASQERGGNAIALVTSPQNFWSEYKKLDNQSNDDLILVQEYIGADTHTYGSGLLYLNGKLKLQFSHDEIRSIPRLGGSGTRLRIFREPRLEEISRTLLEVLGWEGIALVEFKRNSSGEYVLMEINPKFWASYPLASKSGYRFASWMVSQTLGLPEPANRIPKLTGGMVFPHRELHYAIKNNEPIFKSIKAMVWPPSRFDFMISDILPWLPERFFREAG